MAKEEEVAQAVLEKTIKYKSMTKYQLEPGNFEGSQQSLHNNSEEEVLHTEVVTIKVNAIDCQPMTAFGGRGERG